MYLFGICFVLSFSMLDHCVLLLAAKVFAFRWLWSWPASLICAKVGFSAAAGHGMLGGEMT